MLIDCLRANMNKAAFIFFVLLFRAILDCSYSFFVSDFFSYDGYGFDFSISNYLISWGGYLVSIKILSDRLRKVSHYFFLTSVLSVIAPLTSIYGLDSSRPLFPVFITISSLLWIYFLSRLGLISFNRLPIVKSGRSIAVGISILFVVFLVFWFFVSGAKPNLDLSRVYEFRQANAELAAKGVLAYTNNWTFQIFSIYLICFSLYARKYSLCVIMLFVQVYFFAISAHKTILFLPVLVFGVWLYFRKSNSLLFVPIVFSAIILMSMISYYAFDDLWMTSLLSRRVFFMPASLCFTYFEFFSEHAYVYWSNSIFSGLLEYPYGDLGIPYVIGGYLGYPEMGANNGFVSSGFAHGGVGGVFFYATIIGLMLRLINHISSGYMPVWVAVAISVVPLRSLLISSDLFTVMLTHGFAVAVFLMYLSRKRATFSS